MKQPAVRSLQLYSRTIDMGLQVLLQQNSRPESEPERTGGATGIIVFGSDHGLCGRFNEQIGQFAKDERLKRQLTSETLLWLSVGVRAAARLEALGEDVDECFTLPGTVRGLTATAHSILLKIDAWRERSGLGKVLLIHNLRTAESTASPNLVQLLPLASAWLHDLKSAPWPSRGLPTFTMDPASTVRASLWFDTIDIVNQCRDFIPRQIKIGHFAVRRAEPGLQMLVSGFRITGDLGKGGNPARRHLSLLDHMTRFAPLPGESIAFCAHIKRRSLGRGKA